MKYNFSFQSLRLPGQPEVVEVSYLLWSIQLAGPSEQLVVYSQKNPFDVCSRCSIKVSPPFVPAWTRKCCKSGICSTKFSVAWSSEGQKIPLAFSTQDITKKSSINSTFDMHGMHTFFISCIISANTDLMSWFAISEAHQWPWCFCLSDLRSVPNALSLNVCRIIDPVSLLALFIVHNSCMRFYCLIFVNTNSIVV